jgi:MFS family permease
MSQVGGKWNVSSNEPYESPWIQISEMATKGVSYTKSSFFGALIFLKFSAALLYGAVDVLNISFSERGSDEGKTTRLGLLFAIDGIGCLIGPLVVDRYTDMAQPKTIQLISVYSFALTVFGLLMMAIFRQFWLIGLFSGIRVMGSAIAWINSSLLLQKFCEPDMFGRVSSIEYALAIFGEAASALGAGLLQDLGWDAEQVCLLLTFFGTALASFWAYYHFTGGGAASYKEEPKRATTAPPDLEDLTDFDSKPDTEESSLLSSD